jgi:G3E family GTPase
VTLLGNGCLCCNTRTDLQKTLRRLVADRDRGKIPHFGRVLIETSGLADLSPILQTFSTDRALGGEFAIEVVLTVVDAVAGLKNLEKAPEARKQAILADRIVISKTDLADAKTVKKLGGRPVEPKQTAAYNFPVETLKTQTDVLRFAADLEHGALRRVEGASGGGEDEEAGTGQRHEPGRAVPEVRVELPVTPRTLPCGCVSPTPVLKQRLCLWSCLSCHADSAAAETVRGLGRRAG